MLWLVHDGSCHFWYDNWLGIGALFLRAPVVPNLSFHTLIVTGHWDVNLLSHTFPREIVSSILQHPVPDGGCAYEIVWTSSLSGPFTLALAFREARQAHNLSMVLAKGCYPRIPVKVSFFMLRLLLGRLPFLDTLRTLGFPLPSKCFCCQEASEESIKHVFSCGRIALEV